MRAIGFKTAAFASAALLLTGMLLSGCGLGRAFGTTKVSPDEFSIVTKAPLIIPPDYSLKPPAAGAQSASTNDAEAMALRALVGETASPAATMSEGERALVASAGAELADPLIRQVVDQEYAGLIDRSDDFVNRLIFWSDSTPAATVVDASAEAQRLSEAGKTLARAPENEPPSANASGGPASAATPDQIEGQKPPTIGKKTSRLLGIF